MGNVQRMNVRDLNRHFAGDGISWAVSVRDDAGDEIFEFRSSTDPLSIASVGKLLLLVEAARQFEKGILDPTEPLRRTDDDTVSGSGLWQHLAVQELSAADIATLIAAFSDNLATNVLLRRVGIAQLNETAAALGLSTTRLQDRVRDVRTPTHPDVLARGVAGELSLLLSEAARGNVISKAISNQLLRWMSLNADGTMVSATWNLDPLAHFLPSRNLRLANKTGTDTGVRCDVGVASVTNGRTVTYAVIANWNEAEHDAREAVLGAMRAFGVDLRRIIDERPPIFGREEID
jgi:beta-lactamase class A